MFLSFVDPSLVRRHMDGQAVGASEIIELLEFRAIPAGTPVFLDEHTMRPGVSSTATWVLSASCRSRILPKLSESPHLRTYAWRAGEYGCRGADSGPGANGVDRRL